jgi:hypothetical protein
MDVYTPSLVPRHAMRANRWTRACIDQPRVDIGAICTTREVALGVMTIILFAEGPPTNKSQQHSGRYSEGGSARGCGRTYNGWAMTIGLQKQ